MSRRVLALTLAGALAVGTLAACGGDSDERGVATSDRTGTSQGSGAEAYVGLTKKAAIAAAEAAGVTWRITREDDEQFLVTQDYDPERLNFEIDDGTVTKSTYG